MNRHLPSKFNASYLISIGMFFLIGCQESNSSLPSHIIPEVIHKVNLDVDTISFATPAVVRELPFRIFSQSSSNPDEWYLGYDRRTHNIDRFDFTKLKYQPTLRLKSQGPNGLTEIASVYYHNADSIYLLELNPNRLWLMDKDQNVELIVNIKEQSEIDQSMKGLFAVNYNNSCPIYLREQKIYFALRSYNDKYDFTIPILGYYDIKEKRLHTIDIHYPESYLQDPYGFYDFANIAFTKDEIIVNFPISTAIDIYDYKGKLKKTIAAIPEINKTQPISPGSSQSEWLDHLNGSPFLYPIQPYRNGEYFVQFGRDAVPKDKSEIFGYNLIYTKEFDKVYIIRVNKIFFSNGGEYFYHQLPLEKADTQYLERYKFLSL